MAPTTTRKIMLRCAAGLFITAIGCDAAEPEVELREGHTTQFKTQNTDQSFSWKGCEPPWGPDPYHPDSAPTEEWLANTRANLEPDLPAQVLGQWRDADGGTACEEGCASLEMHWTGDVRLDETRHAVRDVSPLGHCDDKLIAWSMDIEVTTSFLCACE